MARSSRLASPAVLPVYFFAATILLGGALLQHSVSLNGQYLRWIDAIFTATSATCVTGLSVVDTGTCFSRFGHTVIMALIQIGGLGVMTYTTLVFYLWRKRVTMTDRLAVGQSLMSDPGFHLGKFLKQLVMVCAIVECSGAIALHVFSVGAIDWYSAFFHAVSAFCNAGFSLYSDNLMRFRDDLGVNLVIMLLIVLGGIGFYVLIELPTVLRNKLRTPERAARLSWQSSVVIRTSLWLIGLGWLILFLAEYSGRHGLHLNGLLLGSLFQSVTTRTAGFNTLDIASMTDISLFVMILLMLIGGSPGSCAGGIKTTTFRVLYSFGLSQIKNREQVVVEGYAVDSQTLNKAITLAIFVFLIIFTATLGLLFTESGATPHNQAHGDFVEILFEVASAFGTVGLSAGLTPNLSDAGKCIVIILMFVGRLGPIVFLTVLQTWQTRERFKRAEKSMLIG